jgi:dTDP-4-dehydrorhamnose reductase
MIINSYEKSSEYLCGETLSNIGYHMKVLVTGANGLLGQHLVKKLLDAGFTVIATGRGESRLTLPTTESLRYYELDLRNHSGLYQLFIDEVPDIVVHAAAMTQVDECEQQPELCSEVNAAATAHLLVIAEEYSKFFIYLSTDFIFDGEKGNYSEEDRPGPLSWYGLTKLQAESMVEISDIPWAIVRTCLVYGNTINGTRRNIITWVKESLEQAKQISVVNDQVRTPTYVEDLATGILLVINRQATGVFHISGKDTLTPYQMALATADRLSLNRQLIREVDATSFSQPGRRPPKTGFVISKAAKELGFEPLSFEEALNKMFS